MRALVTWPRVPLQIKLIFSSSRVEEAESTAHLILASDGAHRGSQRFI